MVTGHAKEEEYSFKVDRGVIQHLSTGMYRDFGLALKEAVCNSYDAGALKCRINFNIDKKQVTIWDNGKGMTKQELDENYFHIGHRTEFIKKRDSFGRLRVGSFGIGCLSLLNYCKELVILTHPPNEKVVRQVKVPASKLMKKGPAHLEDISFNGDVFELEYEPKEGETILTMNGLQDHIVKELTSGKTSKSNTIETMNPWDRLTWTLSQILPIGYPHDTPDLTELFYHKEYVPIRVWLNGEELFRNVPENYDILESHINRPLTINDEKIRYTILTTRGPINPRESRGLQIRFRNVGIGDTRTFEVIKEKGKVLGKINYLAGEIYIDYVLGNDLQSNRMDFYYSEAYALLSEFFRKRLRYWNDWLEGKAKDSKNAYEPFIGLPDFQNIAQRLQDDDMAYLPPERLRLRTKDADVNYKNLNKMKKQINNMFKDKDIKVRVSRSPKKDRTVIIKDDEIIINVSHDVFTKPSREEVTRLTVVEKRMPKGSKPEMPCVVDIETAEINLYNDHPLILKSKDREFAKRAIIAFEVLLYEDLKSSNRDRLRKKFYDLLQQGYDME